MGNIKNGVVRAAQNQQAGDESRQRCSKGRHLFKCSKISDPSVWRWAVYRQLLPGHLLLVTDDFWCKAQFKKYQGRGGEMSGGKHISINYVEIKLNKIKAK